MQPQFLGAALQRRQGDLRKQPHGIVIEFPPARGIEGAEQAAGVLIPAPPQIARQGPEALLRGSDEAVEGARLADDRRNLRGGRRQHLDFVFAKGTRFDGLQDQNTLQHAAVNQRNAQKRLIGILPAFAEVLETRVILHLADVYRTDLLGHQTREALVHSHAQRADRLRLQSDGRRQHQIGAIRLQQIHGADIGAKAPRNQGDDVPQRLRRLAAFGRKLANLLQRQNVIGFCAFDGLGHISEPFCRYTGRRWRDTGISGRTVNFYEKVQTPTKAL